MLKSDLKLYSKRRVLHILMLYDEIDIPLLEQLSLETLKTNIKNDPTRATYYKLSILKTFAAHSEKVLLLPDDVKTSPLYTLFYKFLHPADVLNIRLINNFPVLTYLFKDKINIYLTLAVYMSAGSVLLFSKAVSGFNLITPKSSILTYILEPITSSVILGSYTLSVSLLLHLMNVAGGFEAPHSWIRQITQSYTNTRIKNAHKILTNLNVLAITEEDLPGIALLKFHLHQNRLKMPIEDYCNPNAVSNYVFQNLPGENLLSEIDDEVTMPDYGSLTNKNTGFKQSQVVNLIFIFLPIKTRYKLMCQFCVTTIPAVVNSVKKRRKDKIEQTRKNLISQFNY